MFCHFLFFTLHYSYLYLYWCNFFKSLSNTKKKYYILLLAGNQHSIHSTTEECCFEIKSPEGMLKYFSFTGRQNGFKIKTRNPSKRLLKNSILMPKGSNNQKMKILQRGKWELPANQCQLICPWLAQVSW